MNQIAIKVENLSKQYRLGVIGTGWLVKDLESWWARLRGKEDPNSKIMENLEGGLVGDRILALRDVSFEVKEGEVLGIIGKNGAGKSTLLKILTKVTLATSGTAKLRGRVGSLLEVGTGFHPELTGRENVFLNGAILGMQKQEIRCKFDEIMAFSGVENYIDTPVKRYSSGMKVRLAFSVAAHLEPEILLIDEVLAVGDVEFQKKCLGKMQEVSGQGRTVLFVSHNMPSIMSLCPRTLLLENGKIRMDGPSRDVVGTYISGGFDTTAEKTWPDLTKAPGNEIVRLRALRARNEQGEICEFCDIRKSVGVEMEFEVLQEGHVLVPWFRFFDHTGTTAFLLHDQYSEWKNQPRPRGRFVCTTWIPGNFLADGVMFVGAALSTFKPKRKHFYEENALSFTVVDQLGYDTARGAISGNMPGVVRPIFPWSTKFIPEGNYTHIEGEEALS